MEYKLIRALSCLSWSVDVVVVGNHKVRRELHNKIDFFNCSMRGVQIGVTLKDVKWLYEAFSAVQDWWWLYWIPLSICCPFPVSGDLEMNVSMKAMIWWYLVLFTSLKVIIITDMNSYTLIQVICCSRIWSCLWHQPLILLLRKLKPVLAFSWVNFSASLKWESIWSHFFL